jgi:hypothetical protein
MGLLPLAVPARFTHRDPGPLRQPAHHGVRRQRNLIGHDPEPRQRAQLDCHAQHVAARAEVATNPHRLSIDRHQADGMLGLGTELDQPSVLTVVLVRKLRAGH